MLRIRVPDGTRLGADANEQMTNNARAGDRILWLGEVEGDLSLGRGRGLHGAAACGMALPSVPHLAAPDPWPNRPCQVALPGSRSGPP